MIMNNTASKSERFLLVFGVLLIAIGIVVNEWTVAGLLCPDAEMG